MAKKQIKKYVFEPGISKDANLFPKAVALLSANKAFLQQQVVSFINNQIASNTAPYNGYTYASGKCIRDVGFFIDAILHDLRYGGNVKCRQVADYFWIDGEPQIRGDVSPEITGQAYLRDVINNFIFTNTTVSPSYGNTVSQVKITSQDAETGASARNSTLWSVFSNVIQNGIPAMPSKSTGVSSLRVIGKYDPSEILLITDTNNGRILYSFADSNNTITCEYKQGRSSGNGELLTDVDFPRWWHTSDTITTIKLSEDTSTLSSGADIQIFVEDPAQTIRPWEFGTDAIERMRVAAPQAMLDADFEYGLQPTKWQALGLVRMYPSVYEVPGTDLTINAITTDASSNTGFFGSSLITVTTTGTHGFTIGQPITVKGLLSTVSGFARAEGSFLVYSVPSSVSFTYYASAKVGTSAGESLFTSFAQIRQAGFYTGASVGTPTFSLFSNGTNLNVTSKFITASGSTTIAFDGSSPTSGSPVTGSPVFVQGTAVSGVIGSSTVSARVKTTTALTDTSVELVDATGVQQQMAISSGGGTALFVNSLSGTTLNLSGAIAAVYQGADGSTAGVSGTNVPPVGVGASFTVSRSAGVYVVADPGDSTTNGQNYAVGDNLLILGTSLGGVSPDNDINIRVTNVDSGGGINSFTFTGTAITGGATYTGVSQSSTSGIGSAATLDVTRVGGTGAYSVITVSSGGADYAPGDTVTFSGANFGGTSPENDIQILVGGVTAGSIVDYTIVGTPIGASGDASYPAEPASNIPNSGANAIFTVTRSSGTYSAVATDIGTGYVSGNRIVIAGTSLNGASPLNDCTLTVLSVGGGVMTVTATGTPYDGDLLSVFPTMTISEPITSALPADTVLNVGAIPTIQVDFNSNHGLIPGTTILTQITSNPAPDFVSTSRTLSASLTWTGVAWLGGVFVAVATGTNATSRSIDGTLWAAGGNLPSSTTWTSVAAGAIGATNYFVAIASGGTAAAYSIDGGQNWTASTLPSSSTWSSVAYYNGTFVAVASGGTAAAYSTNGTSWAASTLPASATWSDVVGGLIGTSAYFVAISSGGTAAAYSADNGATWTATGALPASTTWSSIAFGNNRFVAVARGNTNAAISINGITWTAVTLPTSANWNSIAFGDDNFLVVADGGTNALYSFTGDTGSWSLGTLSSSSTWEELAFGSYSGLGVFAVVGNSSVGSSINLTSANHQLATGPHVIAQVPSATSIRYYSRTTGTINVTAQGLTGVVYARPDAFFTHRPFDGGVQLGTGNPTHGAQAIRQSKKYIRYQSGKGIMYTTGGLFAPSYNIASATASGLTVNSMITFTTDDTDHGLQPGAEIEIIGMVSFEYNGDYVVDSIVDARRFRVRSSVVLSDTTGTLGPDAKMVLKRWHGSTVKVGAFDEQNGLFYQYDGQEMSLVKRSSTNQLTGTVSINTESNQVTGNGTRFQDQLKVGDKIVIRGMSHIVTSITNQTSMTMAPDWRGANSITGARMAITEDLYIPQRDWNLDPIDGTGPSGYDMLPWRMQMLGMQYSWYAAGFIEWMLRGADGRFVFLHKLRNSNVNTEAYMRTANLPVRYEVENRSAVSKLSAAVTSSQSTLPLTDASRFPSNGIVYIDNELISYSGKSGNTLTNCTRSASMNAFTAGQNRTVTGGPASSHAVNAGVQLVSCTASPTISHWGSALLTDGQFDEDRGYIFNYAATGLSIGLARQTAFMIRLAPSVSNALVGDLGERDLLNRAQLLLNEVAVTSDSGTGAIVIEGILNPRNYPTDPTRITWTGLSGSGAGGQPSFAQIALGGSINWGGVSATTSTATVQGALTTTITGRAFTTITNTITAQSNPTGLSGYTNAISNGRTDFVITNAAYDALLSTTPLRVGDALSMSSAATLSSVQIIGTGGQFQCASTNLGVGMTVTLTGGATTYPASGTIQGHTNPTTYTISATNGSTTFTLTRSGTPINTTLGFPTGTFTLNNFIGTGRSITAITRAYLGSNFTRIVMNSAGNNTSAAATSVNIVVTNSITTSYANCISTARNDFLVTDTDWTNSFAQVGDSLSLTTFIIAGQSIATVTTGFARVAGVSYTRIVMSSNGNNISGFNTNQTITIQAAGTAASYANTNFLFFTSASWNASGATTGTRVATSFTSFPAGTATSAVVARRLGLTTVQRVTFTQTSSATINAAGTVTFQFGDPQFALPGEQVFSFVTNPGSTTSLNLAELKELTTTAIGGRGAFPNGPDVLAINVYKVTGTAVPGSIILRWGEAQA
jgi:hypothetical protein